MENDPTDIAGQQRRQFQQLQELEKVRKQELADVQELLKTAAGRRYLWRMLGLAGVYQSSFSSDAMQMARSEGRRELGLVVLADITDADPNAYTTMLKEQNQ